MLSKEEKKYLLSICRRTLEEYFKGRRFEPGPPPPDKFPRLWDKRGVFVTLYKWGELRGCIGNISPLKPLFEEVIETTLSSAFSDPRFPPLKREELESIEIEISVLGPLKKALPDEVIPGKHGIYIKRGPNRGLLLPQVATEYGWDRETFLQHSCLKAGLPSNCYLDPDTEIYIFEAEVFKESDFNR